MTATEKTIMLAVRSSISQSCPHRTDENVICGHSYLLCGVDDTNIYQAHQYAYKFAVYGKFFGQWTDLNSSYPQIYNQNLASGWEI